MKIALVFLAALLAGCVSAPATVTGSMLSLDVSPDDLFTSGTGKATLDFTNGGTTPLNNVAMTIYDAGALTAASCLFNIGSVKEGSFISRSCAVTAPDVIEQDVVTTEVKARATFEATLSGTASVSAMSEDEYRIEQAKGGVLTTSPVYVHDDRRLKATVSFSDKMPVVKRPDTKLYMYIDIANVGAGRIETIGADAITVSESGNFASSATTTTPASECKSTGGGSVCVKCPDGSYFFGSTDITNCASYNAPAASSLDIKCPAQKLYIQGSVFPRMTCEITLPADINYLSGYTLILSIDYPYEIRASHAVQVRR
ncbi:MAG: hypothetical protein HY365_03430 [Candidatus Aenigmarchaeota archaeon]|nr:hypothetical protein [Candidatus Aenigmarchaeota archaeon]